MSSFVRAGAVFVFIAFCFVDMSEAKKNIIDIPRMGVFKVAVLRNQKPVVVYFTKSSCAACRQILGNLENIARENDEDMYLARVDLDQYPELRKEFEIHHVPTTRTYYDGKLLRQIQGPLWGSIQAITNHALKTGQQKPPKKP